MSLKAFHLFFIAASIVMALAVGAWGVDRHLAGENGEALTLGIACFVLGGALAVYGAKVWVKFKELPK